TGVVGVGELVEGVVHALAQLLVQGRVGLEEVLGDRELGHGNLSGAGGPGGSSGGEPVADSLDIKGLARPARRGRSTRSGRPWPVPARALDGRPDGSGTHGSGPFLSTDVLVEAFSTGLPALDTDARRAPREGWHEVEADPSGALVPGWIDLVLGQLLEWKPDQ